MDRRLICGACFSRICSSGYIWLGVASLLTFFIAYMLVLTWADYSYVQPASSFSYAMVALLGYLLLGEVVSLQRWFGIAMICLRGAHRGAHASSHHSGQSLTCAKFFYF